MEPDWNQPRPSARQLETMWQREPFEHVADDPQEPLEYLALLRKLYGNGGAWYARFRIAPCTELDWFLSRNRVDEADLLNQLLASRAMHAALPDLVSESPPDRIEKLDSPSAFTLAGELANTLVYGGAYRSLEGRGGEAMRLGEVARQQLIGERFEQVWLYRSFDYWSDAFFGIAWDQTWFGVDADQRTVWLLAMTDTD